nr:EbsA family protein [Lacticaseibacillus absianus]
MIQPAWLDFSIFWALIVSGIALAVIIQMETIGYGWPEPVALALLVITLGVAGLQVHRSTLIITDRQVTLRRLLPGNTLVLPIGSVTGVKATGHTLTVTTQAYGAITFVRLGRVEAVTQALNALI